ncbi:hypothetical protein Bca52824_027998 [Brassica carinata]|uniref:Uncharacterized protein n=1 Tax=Brassica carinata TaxID=52824 RepID=A0A8X7VBR8_BRACI|nr:hypothetical protein Bca52824_027998 [Brassica carinata]
MNTSKTSSVPWEHTQMVRGEGRRPDSTPKGQHSLKGGCSAETGSMGVPWNGREARPLNGSYHYCIWRVGRVDGELGKATSQLYQLEESRWNLKRGGSAQLAG